MLFRSDTNMNKSSQSTSTSLPETKWKNYDYYKDFVGRTFIHKLKTPLEVTGFINDHKYMVIRVVPDHALDVDRHELASMSFIDLDAKFFYSLVDIVSIMPLSKFNSLDDRIVWTE